MRKRRVLISLLMLGALATVVLLLPRKGDKAPPLTIKFIDGRYWVTNHTNDPLLVLADCIEVQDEKGWHRFQPPQRIVLLLPERKGGKLMPHEAGLAAWIPLKFPPSSRCRLQAVAKLQIYGAAGFLEKIRHVPQRFRVLWATRSLAGFNHPYFNEAWKETVVRSEPFDSGPGNPSP